MLKINPSKRNYYTTQDRTKRTKVLLNCLISSIGSLMAARWGGDLIRHHTDNEVNSWIILDVVIGKGVVVGTQHLIVKEQVISVHLDPFLVLNLLLHIKYCVWTLNHQGEPLVFKHDVYEYLHLHRNCQHFNQS